MHIATRLRTCACAPSFIHDEFNGVRKVSSVEPETMINCTGWLRLAVAAGAFLLGSSAHAAEDVSGWDGDARSAARLIAGSQLDPTGKLLRAGVEIRLKPGWHTYWRYPGDAGVPPQFDFKGSQNLHSVEVRWPAPQRLPEGGGISIGYVGDFVFPLRVIPIDPGKPVTLGLKLDYAICEKLCVPAQARLRLLLPRGVASEDAALAAAEARVPHEQKLAQGAPLDVVSVRREASPSGKRVVVELAGPADADLFVEGPNSQWALPLPEPTHGAPQGRKRFTFDLDGLPPGASEKGAPLTLTAVSAGGAIEVVIRLD
jgi:DsbC/DsbD-like thiol-disulfide interchange protein